LFRKKEDSVKGAKMNSIINRYGLRVEYIVLGVLFSFFLYSLPAYGATYYVSPNGSDANPGTEGQPWRTVTKAANTLVAGETVFIRAGTYNEQVVPLNSGNSGNYITYAAYPGETVTIDGSGITLPEHEGLFDVVQRSYIRISGLRVINAGPNDDSLGINLNSSSYVTVEKNYTSNTGSSGILVWSSNNVIIDGNEVVNALQSGVNSHNENITVGGTDTFEISNNHVHHGSTVRGEGIDAKDGSSNGKVYGNHVHHISHVGIYVDAWDKHTHDIDVYQNIVHDITRDGISIGSEQGGLLENVNVYNNISYGNQDVGIKIHNCCSEPIDVSSHPLRNIKIINNTVYNNGWNTGNQWGGGILNENNEAQNVVIRNNIVSQNLSFQIAFEGPDPQNATIDHNLIDGYRGYTGEIRGSDYVEGDPLFVNASTADFHLQSGSPAIDKGSSVNAPTQDYDGNTRITGGSVDIGAYEYGSTGSPQSGNLVTSDLWISAVINTVEKGPVDAVWQKGGEDTTSRGDRVIWGHFYASPLDVTWGSQDNPDLQVR
jgi:parallel beta-helix repeat protein